MVELHSNTVAESVSVLVYEVPLSSQGKVSYCLC